MRQLIQIGGAVVFVLSLYGSVLFAEGYQYDPHGHDLIQKGVIYFEGVPKGVELLADGQNAGDVSLPGEVRLVPGIYDLELKREGYHSWKKRVAVSLQRVVRFSPIYLVAKNAKPFTFKHLAPYGFHEDSISMQSVPFSVSLPNSFHVLVLNKDKTLSFCDKDRENCQNTATLDAPYLIAASDGRNFLVEMDGYFTQLHFGEPALKDQLRSLLSHP